MRTFHSQGKEKRSERAKATVQQAMPRSGDQQSIIERRQQSSGGVAL